ncbi:MAG: NAD(P)-binding domain-containing protein [Candidatus Acidiferrales bacterium]
MHSKAEPTVCIIGAGPYGVAIAAHLQFLDVDFRIFGSPMRRWVSQMPNSMNLKSEACASNLPDPDGRYSLAEYFHEHGLPYNDYAVPLSRELFASYALSFQRKLVPQVENFQVTAVSKGLSGFDIKLDSGETLRSAKVVLATGLDHMEHIPPELRELNQELCSHSADHYDFSKFKGKHVAVIGGGQSALETAAILKDEGASVSLIVRAPRLYWNRIPSTDRRSNYQRLRLPRTRLGDGLKLWVYDNAPQLFHALPRQMRLSLVKATLGPAGAWWLKERVVEQMPVLLGHHVRAVKMTGGRVAVSITKQNAQAMELIADHVVASTGYRFEFQKLPFLSQELRSQIAHDEGAPRLSVNFESTVPGLYFTSIASANSFGPVMRFLAGTDFAARHLASHLAPASRGRRAASAPKCVEN